MSIWLQKSASIQPRTDCRKDFLDAGSAAGPRRHDLSHSEVEGLGEPSAFEAAVPGGTPRSPARDLRASVGKISAKCYSFSAVSTPIFARKYAFCSIFQNLPDYLSENFEIWQFLQILQHWNICKNLNFAEFP